MRTEILAFAHEKIRHSSEQRRIADTGLRIAVLIRNVQRPGRAGPGPAQARAGPGRAGLGRAGPGWAGLGRAGPGQLSKQSIG